MQELDRKAILDAVHELPSDEQLDIVREILSWAQAAEVTRLAQALREVSAIKVWLNAMPSITDGHPSTSSLRGIARMNRPPDDATVERWIDEHRMEKYGS